MVASDITRRVLTGLASVLPQEGRNLITRIDISRAWGDAIQVKIYAGASLEHEPVELRPIFKKAVDDALGQQRHLVEIVWDYRS
jgi:hypothetical protein